MTITRKKPVTGSGQLNLFDILLQEQTERLQSRPGRLNISGQLHAAQRLAAKNAPKSREQIADDMSDLLGITITIDMLNNWLSDSHPHRMPGEYYPAFCIATSDNELLRIQAEAAGVFTLPGPDALRAEIQKLDEQTRELQAEKRKRQLFLQELEGKK